MRRLFKNLVRILFFVAIGFAAYAIFGDLPAPEGESVVRLPVPKASE
jgi:hypothetical protein